MNKKSDRLVLKYSDLPAKVFLAQKAFLLVPLWALPILVISGTIISSVLPSIAVGVYVIELGACLVYFLHEVLGTQVVIEKGFIKRGLNRLALNQVISAGTAYGRDRVLPTKLVLATEAGRSLGFKLSCFKPDEFEKLLRRVEEENPQCKIDPVLATIIRCKTKARTFVIDDNERLTIEYKALGRVGHLVHDFFETSESWLMIGPAIMAVLFLPCWLGFTQTFFFNPVMDYSKRAKLTAGLNEISRASEQLSSELGKQVGIASQTVVNVLANPVIAILGVMLVILFPLWIMYTLLRPNRLQLDQQCLKFNFVPFGQPFTLRKINWTDIEKIALTRNQNYAGSSYVMRISVANGKPAYIDFSAINNNDRIRLMKALERFAPQCRIDSEMAEALAPANEHSYTELWLQSLTTSPDKLNLEPLLPDTMLHHGKYRVVRRLGVGGQGTAYLCYDELEKKSVVLKETIVPVFAEKAIQEQCLKRFESEAAMLSKLDSDSVVRLESFFLEDHRAFLVLEHLPGQNLRQLIASRGRLSNSELLKLADEMCEILTYIHGLSIIHRDFTPDNLVLSPEGKLKLIDFNVAQQIQVGTTGTIAGKHAYLPPEQFRGKPTIQSDLYAMGATLYFLATGEDPEPISKASAMAKVPDVDQRIENLIANTTELEGSKRPPSAVEARSFLLDENSNQDLKERGEVIDIKVELREALEA